MSYNLRGIVHLHLEEHDQAVSQDTLSRVNVGYVLLDKDRLEEALPYFQKAL